MAEKLENGNYPLGIYIFGKRIGGGPDLPLSENAKELTTKVIDISSGVVTTVKTIGTGAIATAENSVDIIGFIKENWKILSVGAVALVVLLKD